jgi:D-alanyl-D-alanine carboxypeptidase/D-alanyl-D-alanine-endopeptidase (penicillin-binding protein 4)
MHSIIRFSLLLLLGALAVEPSFAERPSKVANQIDQLLTEPDVTRAFWGIEVVSLKTGKTLYTLNADKLFTPASNTKMFTTAAVLALIGPDYRFRTTVESTGMVDRHGRLNGDLVLVGRGDPNLSGRPLPYVPRADRKLPPIRVLEDLADQVVQKGVKYVDGDVIGDDSHFLFERYGEGWTQDDLVWEWGAPVSALSINDNVLFVNVLPADRSGERAFISVSPFPEYYRIDNRIMTAPAGTGPAKVSISREPGSNQLTLWGSIPLDDKGQNYTLSIEDPAQFAAQLFRTLLERRGVTIYGRARTRHTELASLSTFRVTTVAPAGGGAEGQVSMTQPAALVLASYESLPIIEDLRVINKDSQNLHAELMLRLLGRERGASGSIEGGLEVLSSFLVQAGITPDEYVLYDGSGLSRQNLVTPRAVVKLLTFAAAQPWAQMFQETMPLAGVDGTLWQRFKNTSAAGRIIGKTGSLGHVTALSGYATTVRGEKLAFAILVNNHKLRGQRVRETIDQILLTLVENNPKKKSPRIRVAAGTQ